MPAGELRQDERGGERGCHTGQVTQGRRTWSGAGGGFKRKPRGGFLGVGILGQLPGSDKA